MSLYNHTVAILYIIFCLVDVIGSSLMLLALFKDRKLRTLNNMYLASLAIAGKRSTRYPKLQHSSTRYYIAVLVKCILRCSHLLVGKSQQILRTLHSNHPQIYCSVCSTCLSQLLCCYSSSPISTFISVTLQVRHSKVIASCKM